jgi:hypothetical protein
MRRRSESFYAKTEEEFEKVTKKVTEKIKKNKARKRSKISTKIEEECDGLASENSEEQLVIEDREFNYYDDMDELGVGKKFEVNLI